MDFLYTETLDITLQWYEKNDLTVGIFLKKGLEEPNILNFPVIEFTKNLKLKAEPNQNGMRKQNILLHE